MNTLSRIFSLTLNRLFAILFLRSILLKGITMTLPLMPKATAVWLVENTSLTFAQIADFCGRKPLAIMKRLRKMISKGEIVMAFPDRITHPHQCYMANDKKQ